MLRLSLFGAGQASHSDRVLPGFPARLPSLLPCYLALYRGHAHHREQLAAVVWGEYPTSVSRKYLRNALWRLRHALQCAGAPVDQYLALSEGSVSFLTSGQYW